MAIPRESSLTQRLHRIIIIAMSTSLLLLLGAFSFYELNNLSTDIEKRLDFQTSTLADYLAPPMEFELQQEVEQLLQVLENENEIVLALVFNDTGEIYAEHVKSWLHDKYPLEKLYNIENIPNFTLSRHDINSAGEAIGSLLLIRSNDQLTQRLVIFILIGLIIFFISFVVGSFISLNLTNHIIRPLSKIEALAVNIREDQDYSVRGEPTEFIELNNMVSGLNALLDDIGHRTQQLTQSEQRLTLALEGSNEGLWDINLDTGEIDFDHFSHKLLGYPDGELPKTLSAFKQIIFTEDLTGFEHALRDHHQGKSADFECEIRLNNNHGQWIWTLFHGRIIEGQSITLCTGTVKDISRRKKTESDLKFLANYDALTGLPNRSLFLDRLNQSVRMAKRTGNFTIMFLDLDRFKQVNDSLGHSIGDELLINASERLTHAVRESDTVSRRGGDEFTLLLHGIDDEEQIEQVSHKIMNAMDKPFYIEGQEINISVSIGISIYPQNGEDSETLLLNADRAMYAAKDKGRNNYQFYSQEMNKQAVERLTMENDLRRALEEEQFELHYQPKVNARTGEITGSEALLRWKHPEEGYISPADFIPLAEITGLIVPIGKWALTEACRQHKEWLDNGIKIHKVSVNLSARQFLAQDVPLMVANVLRETGLSPIFLDLEITEGLVMDNPEKIRLELLVLKSLGVSLAIDDFGTGYSSLSYVQLFPLDTLKVDRSFVVNLDKDGNNAAITSAIIAMAHGLGLKVTVEGVETNAQLAFVLNKDASEIQGYLYSPPLKAEDYLTLLKEQKPLIAKS